MLSVIVPATDEPPGLGACIDAIERSLPAGSELLVERRPAGSGPAAARNAAAFRARGEVLVFVDSDVVVHPDALARIEARFGEDPGLHALFGSYDDRPAAPGRASRFRNLLHHHVHQSGGGPARTFWAGLGAVRRRTFDRVGGFDAARFPRPAIEDVELGCRLWEAGFRIELDPSLLGTHLKAWSVGSMISTDFARRGVPWTRLALERRSLASGPNLARPQWIAATAAAGIVLAGAAGRPKTAALSATVMVAVNAGLYRVLARAGSPSLVAAAIPLHALHYLTAAASVPAGTAAHALAARQAR